MTEQQCRLAAEEMMALRSSRGREAGRHRRGAAKGHKRRQQLELHKVANM
jgi:hypothetical protein